MSERVGVWIVYYTDWYLFVAAVFDDELEARRWAAEQGAFYYEVAFVPFGSEITHQSIKEWRAGATAAHEHRRRIEEGDDE